MVEHQNGMAEFLVFNTAFRRHRTDYNQHPLSYFSMHPGGVGGGEEDQMFFMFF